MTLAAVGQLRSTASLSRNGQTAARLIVEAAAKGARAVFFPEASDYIGSNAQETISLATSVDSSPFIAHIRGALRSLPFDKAPFVSVGIHEPTEDAMRVKNTLVWLDPTGKLMHRYQKVHLFDVEIADGPILHESASVEAGSALLAPFDSPVGKIGAAICYDLRFPEVALRLRSLGADVLLFPSAFTVKTGVAHWHVLARARAIDTQCYVINAAQAGTHNDEGTRESYGHSLVVDPWGDIVAEASSAEEQLIYADVDLDLVHRVRENMPLWNQRRPDVY